MELIKVNSVKLKIILTPSDMTELGITDGQLDYACAASKKAFWDILDKAKTSVDFDSKGDRLYVQFYPSKDGGGELFVTRRAHILPTDGEEKSTYRKRYIAKRKSEGYIISIKDSENLISLCKRLKKVGFEGISALYSDGKSYYLMLSENPQSSFSQNRNGSDCTEENAFICEYGDTFFASSLRRAYLDEHTKLLCDSTVETFCEIFG